MKERFYAVVNRAAGGGRCGRLAASALENLRTNGLEMEVGVSEHPGHGVELTRSAYAKGFRRFIAFGGDGTSHEIVNGLFPEAEGSEPVYLAFQPLGTGNSFLRDFTDKGVEYATQALLDGRSRACDVLRLRHKAGILHYINLLSMGYSADVAMLTNRRLKRVGALGYWLGVFICLLRFRRRSFPVCIDSEGEFDRRKHLFLTFSNSKFTGGTMMIAPRAETDDGLIEYVRWGSIGRMELIRNIRTLYDGTHIEHPAASRRAVHEVTFDLEAPVDVMVDGEVLTLHCESIDVIPSALRVFV